MPLSLKRMGENICHGRWRSSEDEKDGRGGDEILRKGKEIFKKGKEIFKKGEKIFAMGDGEAVSALLELPCDECCLAFAFRQRNCSSQFARKKRVHANSTFLIVGTITI